MSLLLAVLGAAISLVVTQGSIFDPLRQHGPAFTRKLFECPLCLGVWTGGGLAAYAIRFGHFEGSGLEMAPYGLGIAALSGVLALTVRLVWDLLKAAWAVAEGLAGLIQHELAQVAKDEDEDE